MSILKLYAIYLMIRMGFRDPPKILGWELIAADAIQIGEYAILGADIRMKQFRPIRIEQVL